MASGISHRARTFFGTVLLFGSCSVGPAFANGRYPRAERFRPLSADTLLLTGTYGLVVSSNGGTDWHFVCESLLFGRSAGGSWIDPLFELLSDGTIVSGSPHALRTSRDLGCSFETDPALPVDPTFFSDAQLNTAGVVVDITPLPAGGVRSLLALATLNDAEGRAVEHRLYETTDGTASWQQLGAPIPVSVAHPLLTVDVAPSDPTRIYATGTSAGTLVLLRSSDTGLNWDSLPLAIDDEADANGAYIAAVSPSNPDHLYVRVPRWIEDAEGIALWDDSLLFSADGGQSFTDILRRNGNLLGFAISPDASTVLAGFGDPSIAPIYTDTTMLGLYRAAVTDHVFEHTLPELAVSCITWTDTALYVCANDTDPLGLNPDVSFHVGRSTNPDPRSKDEFTPLLKLKDVRGPTPWMDGRTSDCSVDWLEADPDSPEPSSTCESLNACDAAAVPVSAGSTVCGVNIAGSSGSGNGGSAGEPAGLGGVSGSAGTASAGTPGSGAGGGGAERRPDGGSCACRTGPARKDSWALLFPLAWLLLRRLRR